MGAKAARKQYSEQVDKHVMAFFEKHQQDSEDVLAQVRAACDTAHVVHRTIDAPALRCSLQMLIASSAAPT